MPNKMQGVKAVRNFLSHVDGNSLDICAEFYERLLLPESDFEKASELLRCFLDEYGTHSDKTEKIKPRFSEDAYNESLKKVKDFIRRIIKNLVQQNLAEEIFYQKLLENIKNETIFSSECEVVCAIGYCIASMQIPYYQMGKSIQMTDDEFKAASKEILPSLKKMSFILNRGYDQNTEIASQILLLLDSLPNQAQKTVLLAQLLGFYGHVLEKVTHKGHIQSFEERGAGGSEMEVSTQKTEDPSSSKK